MIHLGYRSDTGLTLAHWDNDITPTVRSIGNIDLSVFRFKNSQNPSHFINYNGLLIGSGQNGQALTNIGHNLIGSSFENYYNGNIMEMIVFNTALSDAQVQSINFYLSTKWGLQASVDSDADGTKDNTDPLYIGNADVIKISASGGSYSITSTSSGIVGSGSNPSLNLKKGSAYVFENLASGHPFKIILGSYEKIIDAGEVVQIKVPNNVTGQARYFCTYHPSMANNISLANQSIPQVESMKAITTFDSGVTLNIKPTGDILAGATYSYEISPPISGASIISDSNSSSGYSLKYMPPASLSRLTPYIDISIIVSDQNGNKGASRSTKIYFYREFSDVTSNFSLIGRSIRVPDNATANSEIVDINNPANGLDSVDNINIQYSMTTNDFFRINSTNGKIFLKSNSFSANQPSINVTIYATATTNTDIIGVYANYSFEVLSNLDLITDNNGNGIPDELELDSNGNGIPDEFETGQDEFLFNGDIDFVFDSRYESIFDQSRELEFDGGMDINFQVDATLRDISLEDATMVLETNLEIIDDFILGAKSDGNSEFKMTNQNAKLNIKDDLFIGYGGEAKASFTNGDTDIDGSFSIGNLDNSKGSVVFSDLANIDIKEDFFIGLKGDANVDYSGGTLAVGGSITIGKDSNSKGQFNISNTAKLTVLNDMTIGESGEAYVNCSGGSLTVGGKISLKGIATSVFNMSGGNLTVKAIELNSKESFQFTGGTLNTEQITGTFENAGGTLEVGAQTDDGSAASKFKFHLNPHESAKEKLKNITKIVGDFIQKNGETSVSDLSLRIYDNYENSLLDVSGNVSLAGNLTVSSKQGLTYKLKQSFQLINAKVYEGSFSKVTLPTLSNGLKWNTSQLYTSGTISVESADAASTVSSILTYPNPTVKSRHVPTFHYKLESARDVTLKVYNIFGRQIYYKAYKSTDNGGLTSNNVALPQSITNELAVGIYFIIVHDQSHVLAKGKFAIQ